MYVYMYIVSSTALCSCHCICGELLSWSLRAVGNTIRDMKMMIK